MKPNGHDLYFIQSDLTGDIKIGRTKDVQTRIAQLQTACPHKLRVIHLFEAMGWREPLLHRRMSSYRLRGGRGEWFDYECVGDLPDDLYEQLDLELIDSWWRHPV